MLQQLTKQNGSALSMLASGKARKIAPKAVRGKKRAAVNKLASVRIPKGRKQKLFVIPTEETQEAHKPGTKLDQYVSIDSKGNVTTIERWGNITRVRLDGIVSEETVDGLVADAVRQLGRLGKRQAYYITIGDFITYEGGAFNDGPALARQLSAWLMQYVKKWDVAPVFGIAKITIQNSKGKVTKTAKDFKQFNKSRSF